VVGGYLLGEDAKLSSMLPAAVCPRFSHRVIHSFGADFEVLSGL
jgi:hypothetical protein